MRMQQSVPVGRYQGQAGHRRRGCRPLVTTIFLVETGFSAPSPPASQILL